MSQKPKDSKIEDHLREQLAIVRELNKELTAQLAGKTKDYDRLGVSHEALYAQNVSLLEQIEHVSTRAATTETKLAQRNQDYEFRHNQDLETAAKLNTCRRELVDNEFQFQSFRSEVNRLLLLQQFPGGVQHDLMVTRSRNRILDILSPTPHHDQKLSDTVNECPMTAEELESTQK